MRYVRLGCAALLLAALAAPAGETALASLARRNASACRAVFGRAAICRIDPAGRACSRGSTSGTPLSATRERAALSRAWHSLARGTRS